VLLAEGIARCMCVHAACLDEPENLENLVNLGITREQRLAGAHLGKDAADRPHVDAGRVLPAAEQNLGGAVPQCDNLEHVRLAHLTGTLVGQYLVGVCAEGHAKRAGQTKISELEIAVLVDEEILRLEIAM
jgi:hypothetical protein